ncbi:hypothetical protein B7L44_05200 [Acinetobacter nosocomialis]|uniref:hypothetical protein n=1 Tax=Acinetobacter nosocomialis TaxID=106654 RepID=UPI0009E12865|nr:hypothetical protein [Acinetobacter nosocomialis]ARG16038.1 hypothetical protein B7L44_05200 [Acinetobacter nosocomialis]
MNNLITAAEAFAALQKGKTVLCRPVGDMLDFAELDQFPASVFGKPGFEFCIKAELMELAGIQFTKPLLTHEVEEDQEIFIVMPTRIVKAKFNPENCEIFYSVMNGFAQADADNAVLQLKALGATFGQDIDHIEVEEGLIEQPKKQRSKKVKTEQTAIAEKPSEVIAEAKQPTIVITEQTNVTTSEDVLAPVANELKADPEYQKTLDTLLQRVRESKTPAEVNAVYRYARTWTDEQTKPLLLATHKRLEELANIKPVESEPPSLMVQIQNAPDLITLDALEIDVSARDPQIQPRLMDFVKKRRFELENPADSRTEAEPDYLLEEPF